MGINIFINFSSDIWEENDCWYLKSDWYKFTFLETLLKLKTNFSKT